MQCGQNTQTQKIQDKIANIHKIQVKYRNNDCEKKKKKKWGTVQKRFDGISKTKL